MPSCSCVAVSGATRGCVGGDTWGLGVYGDTQIVLRHFRVAALISYAISPATNRKIAVMVMSGRHVRLLGCRWTGRR